MYSYEKQFVSQRETLCFIYRNNSETISERLTIKPSQDRYVV